MKDTIKHVLPPSSEQQGTQNLLLYFHQVPSRLIFIIVLPRQRSVLEGRGMAAARSRRAFTYVSLSTLRNIAYPTKFQLQDFQGLGLLCALCRQLPRPDVDEGEGQGVPALRKV